MISFGVLGILYPRKSPLYRLIENYKIAEYGIKIEKSNYESDVSLIREEMKRLKETKDDFEAIDFKKIEGVENLSEAEKKDLFGELQSGSLFDDLLNMNVQLESIELEASRATVNFSIFGLLAGVLILIFSAREVLENIMLRLKRSAWSWSFWKMDASFRGQIEK